ncbi:MAG: four helix bundle protein [Bacteroidetes bacterium]|nr:MAG: four helix bundle protein [Bacteroidota bacterium]
MALAEELPIYKACYDLVLALFNLSKNFKKEFKYTLGESLKNEAIKSVTNIFRANSVQDKIPHLTQARENIEVIRVSITHCKSWIKNKK